MLRTLLLLSFGYQMLWWEHSVVLLKPLPYVFYLPLSNSCVCFYLCFLPVPWTTNKAKAFSNKISMSFESSKKVLRPEKVLRNFRKSPWKGLWKCRKKPWETPEIVLSKFLKKIVEMSYKLLFSATWYCINSSQPGLPVTTVSAATH